jgi:hypothetical protein
VAGSWRRGRLLESTVRLPEGSARGGVATHLEVFEPEAVVVRRIFDDYVTVGHSARQICRLLNLDKTPTPTGSSVWAHSTVLKELRIIP